MKGRILEKNRDTGGKNKKKAVLVIIVMLCLIGICVFKITKPVERLYYRITTAFEANGINKKFNASQAGAIVVASAMASRNCNAINQFARENPLVKLSSDVIWSCRRISTDAITVADEVDKYYKGNLDLSMVKQIRSLQLPKISKTVKDVGIVWFPKMLNNIYENNDLLLSLLEGQDRGPGAIKKAMQDAIRNSKTLDKILGLNPGLLEPIFVEKKNLIQEEQI